MTEHRLQFTEISLATLAHSRDGTGHSIFGASGSAMFLHCEGSLIANLLAPDDAGEDAAYGTVAHGVAEEWGKTKKKPKHLLGRSVTVNNAGKDYTIEIDREMMSYVQECIDRSLYLPGKQFWEVKVKYSFITPIPDQGGTADFVCIIGRKLIVMDWKFGKGHTVYARENTQLMLYALGVLLKYSVDYDIDEVELHIIQPRKEHYDCWVTTPSRIWEFAMWAKERMAKAWRLDAPRTPGEKQCEWCKVKSTCSAYAVWMNDVFLGDWDVIDAPVTAERMIAVKERLEFEQGFNPVDPMALTTSDLGFMLTHRRGIESWFKKAEAELSRRVGAGEKTRYWKIVEGRTKRLVRPQNVNRMVEIAAECGIPRKQVVVEQAITPATFEKLLRKAGVPTAVIRDYVAEVAHKPPGRPALALATDPRPALEDLTEGVFDDLIETHETEEW